MIRLMKMMFYDKARHGIGLAYEASSKSIPISSKLHIQHVVGRVDTTLMCCMICNPSTNIDIVRNIFRLY